MKEGEMRLFGRWNALDFAVVLILAASLAGVMAAKAGYAGVDKAIKGVEKINIVIFFHGFKTTDPNLFKVGERTSLTIRNQPVHPPMLITAVKQAPKTASYLLPDGKTTVALPDPSQPYAHDFLVTVSDRAEVSNDGYVVRGNKLKIGNLVELESFKYRAQGIVVDIHPAK